MSKPLSVPQPPVQSIVQAPAQAPAQALGGGGTNPRYRLPESTTLQQAVK